MGGKMILNGKEYMGGKSAPYKEVTLSEYNALPASKLTDGMAYYIKDLGNPYSYPPLIYSDEEREIGVWRDGRPLYQKTVNFGNLPNAEGKDVAHGISNLDRIVAYSAVTKNSTGTTYLPMPRVSDQSQYINDIYFTNEYIHIHSMADRSAHSVFVTMQYTKTTDAPGSGIWTTQGALTHHYSANEKVIGTWIDGKPLYEKTVTFGAISGGAQFSIQSGVTTVDTLVDVNVMCSISGGFIKMPMALPASSAVVEEWCAGLQSFSKSSGNLRLDTGTNRPFDGGFAVFRYTKTTD